MLKGTRLFSSLVALSLAFALNSTAKGKDLNPQKLVAAHLNAIGSPEALAKIKNRGMSGLTTVNFIQGGTGKMAGQAMFASAGPNVALLMKYGAVEYPGEYFAFNGAEVTVNNISPGQRSPLADFVYRYNGLVKEGLLGGVLSLNWPLLDVEGRKARLKYDDAKVEGRKLHQIDYSPRQGLNDVKIKLYFDPETFRHVRSEYRVRVRGEQGLQPDVGGAPNPMTQGRSGIQEAISDSIYLLVEKFEGFKEVDGMMLPHTYVMEYSLQGHGSSFLANWTVQFDNCLHNGTIASSTFVVH